MPPKVKRIMTQPIGFDEYMNLVLDEAEEISVKKKSARKPLVEERKMQLQPKTSGGVRGAFSLNPLVLEVASDQAGGDDLQ